MLLKVLAVIGVIVGGILLFAAAKPAEFRIERSIEIAAPPDKVFPLINDLHNWDRWNSPSDTATNETKFFSGSPSGVGASCEWSGKGQTGQGHMTIVESVAARRVVVQVDWKRPFATRNMNEFTLDPAGDSTKVTWSMHGRNLYIMKLMGVFVSMDKVMGKHFESGLASLKSAAELAKP
jgi:uncharacterized protein YndB with AHSA1/START domain